VLCCICARPAVIECDGYGQEIQLSSTPPTADASLSYCAVLPVLLLLLLFCRHLGAGSNRGTAVDVDYGGVSFEVTQLDGVLEL